jgi:ABC-type oligopeptide transport system substrate-binding subunit
MITPVVIPSHHLIPVGVKALDDFTLQVSLNNPTPFFLGLLSHYSTWPVHKETGFKTWLN